MVVDEMQDYSWIQFVLLKKLFPCKMTILGDKAQTMEEQQQDVQQQENEQQTAQDTTEEISVRSR